MKKMTKLERRILDRWTKAVGPRAPAEWKVGLRDLRADSGPWSIRRLAYHEAGHVVGRAFTEGELPIKVSIMPNMATGEGGSTVSRVGPVRVFFESYPPPMLRAGGRQLLLGWLAGLVAENRIVQPELRKDLFDPEHYDWDAEGSDLFEAAAIATIMERPRAPQLHILQQAVKWTDEMLALPSVWRCVEALAAKLLDRGTISNPDIVMQMCHDILCMGFRLPKWRRRFGWTRAEAKKYGLFGTSPRLTQRQGKALQSRATRQARPPERAPSS